MKNSHHVFISCIIAIVVTTTACRKNPETFDIEESRKRQIELEEKLHSMLADPNGWTLLIPSRDTSLRTAFPVQMRFDREKGLCHLSSPYPLSDSAHPCYYELSSATGAPMLSVSTASLFTYLFEDGTVSDYFFKMKVVSEDTIIMQPYRSGGVYKPEGGIPMKLIRQRQRQPFEWQSISLDSIANLLLRSYDPVEDTVFFRPLTVTYKDGYTASLQVAFIPVSAGNMSFFRSRVPLVANYGMYPLHLYVNDSAGDELSLIYCGNSALMLNVLSGYTPANWFSVYPAEYIRLLKTNLLLVKNIDIRNGVIYLFALGPDGEEIMTGSLGLRR